MKQTKKLTLRTEAIRALSADRLETIRGGSASANVTCTMFTCPQGRRPSGACFFVSALC